MEKMRWGIAAPGNIARKFATAAKNLPEVELCAVASRDIDRANAFGDTYGIAHRFASYEEMAASPLVDFVYVAPPHPFHKGVAEIFLKAGKHVLCEKPLCINEKDAAELFACAREHGAFLMEAMWTRFLPANLAVAELIQSGEIGEVRGLTADFCYNLSAREESKIFRNDMAGGSVLDVGIYPLHLAAMMLGTEVESISATATVEDGCDTHTQMVLKYKSGAIATLSSATKLYKPEDAYIYGTKGYIHIPTFYGAKEFTVYHGKEGVRHSHPFLGNGFEEEILEVMRCVREGKAESDGMPAARTLAILSQMDEVRRQIGVRYPQEG